MLISYPSIEHQHRFNAHKAAIDAARASGVKHVFYSSLALAAANHRHSKAHVMQAHLDTEAYLRQLAEANGAFSFTSIMMGNLVRELPYVYRISRSEQAAERCILSA